MLYHHPTIEEMETFLRSASPASTVPCPLHVVRHLLAGCSSCCSRLQAAGWTGRRLQRFMEVAATETDDFGYDYQPTFAAIERRLAAFFAIEAPFAEPPQQALSAILHLTEEDQVRSVSTDSRLWHPEIIRSLIDRSHAVRYEDPRAMLHLAQLARLATEACPPAAAGSAERLADLKVQAWGHLGNSFRVCGQLQQAEDSLATAQRYRREGTGDPPLHARLLEQWASLRTFQRRFAEAMALATEAGRIYREIEQPQKLAGSLLHKAIAAIYAGQHEPAIRILNQAIPLIDPEENPQLLFSACHNLIICYIDAQKPEQALSLYFEARDLYRELDGYAMIHLRTAWQEGQLLRDLGHLQAAEAALRRTRQGFLDQGLFYEVAVVSLDLAAVYVRLGKVEDVRQTAIETVPIFRALRVEREVLGSLLQLQQAAGQEQQALELIRLLNTQLAPFSKYSNSR
jgi:tetratricopeptide (TPR) repeat protein